MGRNERQEILDIISIAQEKCAPVELKIGTVSESGQVVHSGVYIKDCPASVVEALQKAGWVLGMDDGWLHPLYKRGDE